MAALTRTKGLHLPVVEYCVQRSGEDVLDDMPGVKTLIWYDQGAGQAAPERFLSFDAWYRRYPVTTQRVILLYRFLAKHLLLTAMKPVFICTGGALPHQKSVLPVFKHRVPFFREGSSSFR